MGFRVLTRRIKMDLTYADEDVCAMLFTQARAQKACRLFLDRLKANGGLTRSEMSRFADNLEAGKVEEGFRYGRRQFYAQISRTLLMLGLIAIEQRLVSTEDFDVVWNWLEDKYVPVRQPISKRPPDDLNLPRLVWNICKAWNEEFLRVGGEELEWARRRCLLWFLSLLFATGFMKVDLSKIQA